jgi:hypothetical protein
MIEINFICFLQHASSVLFSFPVSSLQSARSHGNVETRLFHLSGILDAKKAAVHLASQLMSRKLYHSKNNLVLLLNPLLTNLVKGYTQVIQLECLSY